MTDLYFLLEKSVDVAGKTLKEKYIIFCEKFIAEHSTWPRRKLVRSGLGIPQQTARRAIDINIVVFIIKPTQLLKYKNSIYEKSLFPHASPTLPLCSADQSTRQLKMRMCSKKLLLQFQLLRQKSNKY